MTDLVTGHDTIGSQNTAAPITPEMLEEHRVALTGYCYRMLGSGFEAEDAVQEAMVRAWRSADRFEGRSALKTWMHRIATNVCLDMLEGRKRRALPMDMGPATTADATLRPPLPESTWVQPIPDGRVLPTAADPAEVAVARETVRLAFVAALQHLPPRQRAVLILREVLRWRATEVADLLDTTVVSVNSALQRARATLAETGLDSESTRSGSTVDDDQQALLDGYVAAFERYDMDALVALLAEDATQVMPPFELWLVGRDEIRAWLTGQGRGCEGSRLVPLAVNGVRGFAQYRQSGTPGRLEPFSIQVLDLADGRITGFCHFVDPSLFPLFGLPDHLEA